MSFQYIQEYYGVPAEVGRRVEYTGDKDSKQGVIVEENGQYIFIHFDGDKKRKGPFHPTWELKYLGMGKVPKRTAGQDRYARFLASDCFDNFAQFLGFLKDESDAKKCGFLSVYDYYNWIKGGMA